MDGDGDCRACTQRVVDEGWSVSCGSIFDINYFNRMRFMMFSCYGAASIRFVVCRKLQRNSHKLFHGMQCSPASSQG